MPNILKQRAVVESREAVAIPDTPAGAPVLPTPEEPADSGTQQAAPALLPSPPPAPPTRREIAQLFAPELEALRREARETAYRQGRTEGLAAGEQDVRQCLEAVERHLAKMDALQNQYLDRYAAELKYLAVDIAEKFIQQKIAEDDQLLEHLVLQTVGTVRNAKWMTVEVSDKMTELAGRLRQLLQQSPYAGRAEVLAVPGPADTCRVDTDSGAVTATVSAQAENLRQVLSGLDADKK